MPAIGPGSLVLVTGASGFLAAHCVHQLLERGHSVRGTVRSKEKGEYLEKLFEKRHKGKFTFVIAEDLEKPNVFDEAVKGVDGVLHTASPFHMNAENKALDALINPAVKGTKSVLNSIAKENKIKRVVITSSFAAIIDAKNVKPPFTFTEKDWNKGDPIESEQQGNSQQPLSAYRASKTLAERAAWEFVESEKRSFDLVTINPPLVLGPIIHQCSSPESLNTSSANIWKLLHGGKPPAGCAVDVRDTAKAHVEALLRSDAGNQRFAPSIGAYTFQEVSDIVHSTKLDLPQDWKNNTPKDVNDKKTEMVLDGSKSERELGIQYHTLKQTIEDALVSFMDYEKRDWKGIPSEEVVYLP